MKIIGIETDVYGMTLVGDKFIGSLDDRMRIAGHNNTIIRPEHKGGVSLHQGSEKVGILKLATQPSVLGKYNLYLPDGQNFGAIAVLYPNYQSGFESPEINFKSLTGDKVETYFITDSNPTSEDQLPDKDIALGWGRTPLVCSVRSLTYVLNFEVLLTAEGSVVISPVLEEGKKWGASRELSMKRGIPTAGLGSLR